MIALKQYHPQFSTKDKTLQEWEDGDSYLYQGNITSEQPSSICIDCAILP